MPYQLSEEQIAFILDDMKKRGINIEDLQLSLLDHICCLVEKELKEDEDFEAFYNENIKRFFNESLSEIEDETRSLLKNRNFYKMKKVLYGVLFLSLSYNIFCIAKGTISYIRTRQWQKETFKIPDMSLNQGYQDFKEKVKEKYPHFTQKKYLCVIYPGYTTNIPQEMYEQMLEDMTPQEKIRNKERATTFYRSVDSIASIYKENINFVFAYQRKTGQVEKHLEEFEPLAKNCSFSMDQNKLFSGYLNRKKPSMTLYPLFLFFDKNDTLVKDFSSIVFKPINLSLAIRKLPN